MHFSPPRRARRSAKVAAAAILALAGGGGLTVAAAPAASAATCASIDVVVARGTSEPGILGSVVGDPLYAALQTALAGQTTSSYRVNYPADTNEPSSVEQGNTDLVNHVIGQALACPAQRFILVGYSQGANVVDNSIGISSAGALVGGPIVATLPAWVQPRIAALLLFGNPIRALGESVTGSYASRTDDFCAVNDPVCQPGGTDWNAHLSYGSDVSAAAGFAAYLVYFSPYLLFTI